MSDRRSYPIVETFNANRRDWLSKIANVLNRALVGKLNNTGTVTLTANAASTTLTNSRIGANSVIILMPTTANAVAALPTTYDLAPVFRSS